MKKIIVFMFFAVLFSLNVNALSDVSAKSAILINGTTGEVIFSKNVNEQLPMASTTKIMTALLLAEKNTPQKQVTVTKRMVSVEGSSMGLLPNDKVTYNDLLYGMLLASGNDAANSVAYLLGGSIEGFAKLMNSKAKEIGLLHTNFVTPSGLDDDNHYTTARDMAILARFAMQNDAFRTAASSKTAVLNYGNPPYRRQITNHNKLLNLYDGAIGVKTGFTKKSGRCLVSAAKRNEAYLIAVTLNAPNDWQDHAAMFDYGFEKLNLITLNNQDDFLKIPVLSGDFNEVFVKLPKTTVAVSNENQEDFCVQTIAPDFLFAPINKGEKIGKMIVKYKGEIISQKDLFCEKDISVLKTSKNFFQRFFEIYTLFLKQIRS